MMALDFNDAEPQGSIHNLHALPCRPNADAMRAMLSALFRDASSGLVELSSTSRTKPHSLSSAQLFDLTQLDELIEMAARLSAEPNRNLYVSAGLRHEDCARDKRAKDADVVAVSAAKVDFDKPGSYEAALPRLASQGLTPNVIVITGRHPHVRAQLWFVLDEPATDLAVVSEIERRLALWLDADTSITNPSRVMRLAGSVAWPLKAGRKLEMTELVTNGLRAAPYSLDELKSKVREAVPLETKPEPNIFDFNTASRQGGTSLDEYIAAAREPGRWHDSVLRAIAHLTRKGAPPDALVSLLSHAVTQPGYSIAQTRDEVAVMVRGALQRGFVPSNEEPAEGASGNASGPALSGQWIDELQYVYQPEIVEDLIPSRGVGVVFGPSSAGKSFVVVDWAMEIASGGKVLDQFTVPSGVLYFAAEGQDGLKKRLVAARGYRGLDAVVLPFNVLTALLDLSKAEARDIERLCSYAENIASEMQARGAPLRVVFIDTLAAAAPGADENAGKDMGPIMQAFHRMSQRLGIVVVLVAHTGKDETRGIRGWSGIRANIEFAVECQVERDPKTKEVVKRSLYLEKAKDGRDGFVLAQYGLAVLELGKKQSGKPDTTCIVQYSAPAAPSPAAVAEEIEREARERLAGLRRAVLDGIAASLDDGWMAARETAIRLRESGMSIGRSKLVDILQTFASPRQEDLERIPHGDVSIEVRTQRSDSRTTLHFRVIRDA